MSSFQSPSLRGSGRFKRARRPRRGLPACFNPLHCGAVVASYGRGEGPRGRLPVSIPFIAGQWSLPEALVRCGDNAEFQSPSLRGSGRFSRRRRRMAGGGTGVSIPFIAGQWSLLPAGRAPSARMAGFNPLHCGAVVASRNRAQEAKLLEDLVSIPFIAGQWSLQNEVIVPPSGATLFQSPSLRGSGRFRSARSSRCARGRGFNPLHCGAVVASGGRAMDDDIEIFVSIPFIAGQWSLRLGDLGAGLRRAFQSPSLRGSGRFIQMDRAGWTPPPCFNPLHCGAVVASACASAWHGVPGCVSIPFIAGQWSLHARAAPWTSAPPSFNPLHCGAVVASLVEIVGTLCGRRVFQSPSLRGSGRFPSPHGGGGQGGTGFNPLHCGAVVASKEVESRKQAEARVSIPFIAGQWSLRGGRSGEGPGAGEVSIPFIAGQWSLPALSGSGRSGRRVSIPFIAGQWSLRIYGGHEWKYDIMFQSPSLRGSGRFYGGRGPRRNGREVSIPFIAGQWSLRASPHGGGARRNKFQSPSLRGSGRFPQSRGERPRISRSFNPLHCGAVVASFREQGHHEQGHHEFQSPSLRGSGRFARG